ncbi:hypothetical protein [Streptacidiphilus griseoplanus]|uniref:hypothetical protein n=1 Tax=Peterkaempfera griseoplana TaxID=66896 RepID=UPI000A4845C3|nr:hypothetical protein [Peterkaempfera griseoplana]
MNAKKTTATALAGAAAVTILDTATAQASEHDQDRPQIHFCAVQADSPDATTAPTAH